jgi:hypothetical protein
MNLFFNNGLMEENPTSEEMMKVKNSTNSLVNTSLMVVLLKLLIEFVKIP